MTTERTWLIRTGDLSDAAVACGAEAHNASVDAALALVRGEAT